MKNRDLGKRAVAIVFVFVMAALIGGCVRDDFSDPEFKEWAAHVRNKTRNLECRLTFGLVPSGTPVRVLRDQGALLSYLSGAVDCEVRPVLYRDYDELIRALAEGQVDFAKINALGYVKAAATPGGARCLLQRTRNGEPAYWGSIITRTDSGMETLKDLKKHSFMFVDKNSTSGYLFPRHWLRRNGLNPDRDFSSVTFSGTGKHFDVVLAVLQGEVDAGAVHKGSPSALEDEDDINSLRVLADYGPIPEEPIAVRGDLDKKIVKKLKAAFLAVKTKKFREKYFQSQVHAYIQCEDENYDVLREMLEAEEGRARP